MDKDSFVPQARMLRLFQFVQALSSCSLSTSQLAEMFSMTQRSVYRYIHALEELEIPIEQNFQKEWFIAQDVCPFCGKGKEDHHG